MTNHQIINMFLGLSLADALGVPVEFKSREELSKAPVNTMLEYGTYDQKAGTWSDDSSLTFCLAESLTKEYDLKDIASKFIQWMHATIWTPHDDVFDIGNQTKQSIYTLHDILQKEDYESLKLLKYEPDEFTNGNGSLMRILPLVVYIKGKPIQQQFDIIWEVSALTHGHIRSAISCLIHLKFAEYLIENHTIASAYAAMQNDVNRFLKDAKIAEREIKHFDRLLANDISKLEENEIRSDGYVIHTLEASFWCLLTTDSYLESVFKAINLGDDTDTTATVVGGIAGFFYGLDEVPNEWLNALARKTDIVNLSNALYEKYEN